MYREGLSDIPQNSVEKKFGLFFVEFRSEPPNTIKTTKNWIS
jgi:hypothetical protein